MMCSLQDQRTSRSWLLAVIVAVLTPPAIRAQDPKVIIVGERPMADAVKTLGCKLGVGQGAGNAAKINAYLASRPGYDLYLPGGALEIDDTLVTAEETGGFNIYGNGPTADLNDNNYNGGIKAGQPSRLVWAGPEGEPMIQWNSRMGSIRGVCFQGRPIPTTPTATKARIGIHVRTAQQTSGNIPVGKLRLEDCAFLDVCNPILFGYDLDTALGGDPDVGTYNNSDESMWHNCLFYFPFNAGAGDGQMSATPNVVTLNAA